MTQMTDLSVEEKLKSAIEAKFPGDVSNAVVPRKHRVWLDVKPEKLPELLKFMRDELGFNHLATVTGLDLGEHLAANYHMTDTHCIVTVKARTPRANPVFPTVTGVFPGALSYEMELEDMFGIKIEGLVVPMDRKRYPLPDDFPVGQYPLRKDWDPSTYPPLEASQAEEKK